MRAIDFEFRHRYFLIMAIYAVGFSCYWIDHRNAAQALLSLIGQDNNMSAIGWLIAFGSLVIALGALLRTWATGLPQKRCRARYGAPQRLAGRRLSVPAAWELIHEIIDQLRTPRPTTDRPMGN